MRPIPRTERRYAHHLVGSAHTGSDRDVMSDASGPTCIAACPMIAGGPESSQRLTRLNRCRALIRFRRGATMILGAALRGPPLLDMMLALYAAELEGRALCQSSIESDASRASTHRHAALLVRHGLAVCNVDPRDHRRKTVSLTIKARQALDGLMDEMTSL